MPSGRISLVSGDPAPETDTTSPNIYLAEIDGNQTEFWDGAAWVPAISPGELVLPLTAADHPLAQNFDVFETLDAGVPVICTGPAWANDITRSADIEIFQGRAVNAVSITGVNGSSTYAIPARAANLRGGFRTSAAGQTKSTKESRLVWDLCRPRSLPVVRVDTTPSWQWNTTSFHQANGSAANRIAIFNGVSGRMATVTASGYMVNGSSAIQAGFVGVGLDSSTVDSSQTKNPCAASNAFPVLPAWATFSGYVGIGYHELRWIERGNGGAAQTWFGSNGYSGYGYQTGLVGSVVQ